MDAVLLDVGDDSIDDEANDSILEEEELLELNDCLSDTTEDKHRCKVLLFLRVKRLGREPPNTIFPLTPTVPGPLTFMPLLSPKSRTWLLLLQLLPSLKD